MTSDGFGKLPRQFFRRPTLEVAHDLIGKVINLRRNRIDLSGRIVETEAYIGEDDPACHARFGKTARNAVMYGDAGYVYVYFIYGMYHMLNFVTESNDQPAAVLIRALEPLTGLGAMQKRRGVTDVHQLTSGPGKLCQAMAITTVDTGVDLAGDRFHVADDGFIAEKIITTPRIGVRAGGDRPWRFYDANSSFVSVKRVPRPV